MTVTLPPEHPIVKTLARKQLPLDNNSAEYKDALRRLGGEKRWKGQTRRLKVSRIAVSSLTFQAEAQNDAVRQCIADNGLLWVNYEVMSTVDPGTYLGEQAARLRGGRPLLTVPVQPSQHASKRPMDDGHTGARSVKPKLSITTASTLKVTEDAASSGNGHAGGTCAAGSWSLPPKVSNELWSRLLVADGAFPS